MFDTGFAGNGITTASGGGTNVTGGKLYRYADGRILAGAGCTMASGNWRMCFARFLADGTPDPLFGGGDGYVDVQTNGTDVGFPAVESLEVLADGRIVGDGVAELDLSGTGNANYSARIVMLPDGRMFAVAMCGPGDWQRCTARLLANGSFDSSYDGDGRRRFLFETGYDEDDLTSVFVDDAGRYVVVGRCYPVAGNWYPQLCVSRQLATGQPDTTFSGDGMLRVEYSGFELDGQTYDTTIDAEGRLVSVAVCDNPSSAWNAICVERILPDGTLDPTLAGDGTLTLDVDATTVYWTDIGLTIDETGNILVAHACSNGSAVTCLLRLLPDGTRDTSMGTNGIAVLETGSNAVADYGSDVIIAPDGAAIVVAKCNEGASVIRQVCIMRLREHAAIDNWADDGSHDWDTPGTTVQGFGICLRTTTGGASPIWPSTGTCGTADAPHWRSVATAPSAAAETFAPEPIPADATARFRFGLRVRADQPAGRYVAPITFTVTAPNA